MNKLKPEIKDKWVTTLRSGDFAQGKGSLRPTTDTYCCLGVLCMLYQRETRQGTWHSAFRDAPNTFFSAELDVYEWAGLHRDPTAPIVHLLATMNDRGDTFEQIAQYIQTNL